MVGEAADELFGVAGGWGALCGTAAGPLPWELELAAGALTRDCRTSEKLCDGAVAGAALVVGAAWGAVIISRIARAIWERPVLKRCCPLTPQQSGGHLA